MICVVTPTAQVVKADRVQVVRAKMLMAMALEMGELAVRKRTAVWVGRAVAVLPETGSPESLAN